MKYCAHCGAQLVDEAVVCPKCGCAVAPTKTVDPNASPKSRLITLLLCIFVGGLGIHRFYVGKIGTGVPIGGQLVAFRFPARWDASVKTIADATTSILQGQSRSIDSFIRVTGTVKAMPEAVSSEIYSWYTDNHDYLQKIGAIGDSDDAADYLPDAIVRVDYVGGIPQGWVEGLTVAAVACLIYAIVVFIRILCGKYDEQKLPDITFELVDMTPETPAEPETTPEETPEAAAEPETAPEETPEAKPEAETPAEPEKSDETEDTPNA